MKRTLLLVALFAAWTVAADSPSNLPKALFEVFTPTGKPIPDADIVLTPIRLEGDPLQFRHGRSQPVRPDMYRAVVRFPDHGYGDYSKSVLILGDHYQRIILGGDPRSNVEYAFNVYPPEIVGNVIRKDWLSRDLVVRAVALADGPTPQALDAKVVDGSFRLGFLDDAPYGVLLMDGFELLEAKSVKVQHATYPARVVFGEE